MRCKFASHLYRNDELHRGLPSPRYKYDSIRVCIVFVSNLSILLGHKSFVSPAAIQLRYKCIFTPIAIQLRCIAAHCDTIAIQIYLLRTLRYICDAIAAHCDTIAIQLRYKCMFTPTAIHLRCITAHCDTIAIQLRYTLTYNCDTIAFYAHCDTFSMHCCSLRYNCDTFSPTAIHF